VAALLMTVVIGAPAAKVVCGLQCDLDRVQAEASASHGTHCDQKTPADSTTIGDTPPDPCRPVVFANPAARDRAVVRTDDSPDVTLVTVGAPVSTSRADHPQKPGHTVVPLYAPPGAFQPLRI
jgi:hypothetical protein